MGKGGRQTSKAFVVILARDDGALSRVIGVDVVRVKIL